MESPHYQPQMEMRRRTVGWIEPPVSIVRNDGGGHRAIDLALVGRVRVGEGGCSHGAEAAPLDDHAQG